MYEIVISIVFIVFLINNICYNLKNKKEKYVLYIFIDIVFYLTLIILNYRSVLPVAMENIVAIILLIILPVKLWCYKKTH